jgi:molybdopterin-guanine dinucleotide biosynthesis protein A
MPSYCHRPAHQAATAGDSQDRLAWKALRVIWEPEKGQDGPVDGIFVT